MGIVQTLDTKLTFLLQFKRKFMLILFVKVFKNLVNQFGIHR